MKTASEVKGQKVTSCQELTCYCEIESVVAN